MSRYKVEFHEAAAAEAVRQARWYAEERSAVARVFVTELSCGIQRIAESPDRWPAYIDGTRRFLLRRFPLSIVYCLRGSTIHVLAVAHAKRRPGYWTGRGQSVS